MANPASAVARPLEPQFQIRWVRPAQQARSQQTQERLLDAAEALIADKGFAEVTVAEIAARAGCSVGAVYSRFRDKEALFHCLQDRLVREIKATADAALAPELWGDASVSDIAGSLIAFMVEVFEERGGVLREIAQRVPHDLDIHARAEDVTRYVSGLLQQLLVDHRGELRHPEPEIAVPFAYRMLAAMLRETLLFRGPGAHGIPSSDQRLAAELTRAFLGYLGAEPAIEGDGER